VEGDGEIRGQIQLGSAHLVPMRSGLQATSRDFGNDNLPPVLDPIGNQTVNEGATLTFTISATDPSNDPLIFSAGNLPLGATFDPATRIFSWTPTEVQGPGTFSSITFAVSDNHNNADSETISIAVNEVNQTPVLDAIGNRTVQVGATLSFTVTATDPDLPANLFTLSSSALSTGATFDVGTGLFSWAPTAGQVGDTSLTFTVMDNGTPVRSDFEDVLITVTAAPVVNQPPEVNDQSYAVAENRANGTVVGAIAATDLDVGQVLSYAVTGTAFAVDAITGQITVANSALLNFETTPSFTLTATVTDNGTPNLSDMAVITINLADINEAPALGAIGNQTVDELATLNFLATATDVDAAQTATFTLDAAAVGLGATIDATTGAFSWTPTEAQGAGIYDITITVVDNGTPQLSDSETIQIQVNEVNVAPVLGAIGDRTVDEGTLLAFTITGTDTDLPANTLTFSASGLPTGANFDPATRTFSWTPTEAQGPGVFTGMTFTVIDGQGGTDSETISITVNEVNVAPVLGAIGNQTVQVGQPLTFTVTATDADLPANGLVLSSSALPTGATFDANTGVFSWTPTAGQVGDTGLTFTVTDTGSPVLSDSETLTITVTAEPNQNPVAVNDGSYAATEDQLLTVLAAQGVLANDSDPNSDPLSVTLLQQAVNGVVTLASNGGFTYQPTANVNGSDSFSYTLNDGRGGTATATVSLTVAAVNDAYTTNKNTALTMTALGVLVNDTDVDSTALTASLVSGPANGTLTLDANGGFIYTSNLNFTGTDSFTYRANDGQVNSANLATVTLTVTEPAASFTVAPPTLEFQGTVDGPNQEAGVTIANTGTTDLTVTWQDSIFWLVATSGDVVTIAPGASADISHTASMARLTAGVYTGTATVSSGSVTELIPVTLTVTEPAVSFTVAPPTLEFQGTVDGRGYYCCDWDKHDDRHDRFDGYRNHRHREDSYHSDDTDGRSGHDSSCEPQYVIPCSKPWVHEFVRGRG
jgi:hypothetical protein